MKKTIIFPALFVIVSVISAVVFRNPFTYINLGLSVVILCLALFGKNNQVLNRIQYSALWFLILELIAFALLLVKVNFYNTSYIWIMYVVFLALEVFVTPRIAKEK